MREILYYIEVIDPNMTYHLILVNQIIKTNLENIVVEARKIYTLDNSDGERVQPSDNWRYFTTRKGVKLRVVGHGIMPLEDQSIRNTRGQRNT